MTESHHQEKNSSKFVFGVTSTDRIINTEQGDQFIEACLSNHGTLTRIILTCYRAAGPLTELVLFNEHGAIFTITIDFWKNNRPGLALTDEYIRTGHMMVYVNDSTDMLILATRLARKAGLVPSFPDDANLSSVLEFTIA
ncbi:hypothetical protein VSS22_24570 [Klebsiella pneumoniae]|jgi:hypothetical protein|uniref:hypothetical protein n=1 Tax=Klebsiella TaxID=570 RepID=UPI0018C4587E|nr:MULTISPECIES: hypothetical protein [Klebsiella]HCC2748844.1 hypothetical protein [Klebsiella quasipneumoniae]HCP7680476.1 hypothetical protein [Escherichia coli]MBD7346136.1 hypothetical protein [Klebsiella pneumoniae]MBD7356875.1 hypothetical protein [Klebsiella pneumoniae]MBD7367506.1 hypothetical protein [Klebsiella pneumoniae]